MIVLQRKKGGGSFTIMGCPEQESYQLNFPLNFLLDPQTQQLESSANTVDFELFLVSLNSKAMCHLLGKTSKQVLFFTAGLKLSRCLKEWRSESHFPWYPRAQRRVKEWFSLWLFCVRAYVNVMRVYACICACVHACVWCVPVRVYLDTDVLMSWYMYGSQRTTL